MASRTAALQESQCLEKGNSATIESLVARLTQVGAFLAGAIRGGASSGGVSKGGDSGEGAFGGGGDTSGGVDIC